jgi:hypothetical protein
MVEAKVKIAILVAFIVIVLLLVIDWVMSYIWGDGE